MDKITVILPVNDPLDSPEAMLLHCSLCPNPNECFTANCILLLYAEKEARKLDS